MVIEGKHIYNNPLPTNRQDMPPVPTPDVIATYKRRERHLRKRRQKWEAEALANVPSVTVPDHSVLAAFPEPYWRVPHTHNRKDKSARKGQEAAQEVARLAAFKEERAGDIGRAVNAETQKYQAVAAKNKELEGQKGDDARAYSIAMLINGLAERPNQHVGEQLQQILANLPIPVKWALDITGKMIPGEDIVEQLSKIANDKNAPTGGAIANIGKVVRDARGGLVEDAARDYADVNHKRRDPAGHQRKHALKNVAEKATSTAFLALLSKGNVEGLIAGKAAQSLIKKFIDSAPEVAETLAKVGTDILFHRKGAQSAAHLIELFVSLALGKEAKGMTGQVVDYLFAEYAVEHPGEFGNLIKDTIVADMYHDAKKADEAIIGRVKETMFRRTKAEKDAKAMSERQSDAIAHWGK